MEGGKERGRLKGTAGQNEAATPRTARMDGERRARPLTTPKLKNANIENGSADHQKRTDQLDNTRCIRDIEKPSS